MNFLFQDDLIKRQSLIRVAKKFKVYFFVSLTYIWLMALRFPIVVDNDPVSPKPVKFL